MNKLPPLRLDYPRRLVLLLSFSLAGLIAAGIVMGIVVAIAGGQTTPVMRISAVVQDLFAFILPAVATAVFATSRPASLLCLDRLPSLRLTILAVGVMITSIPLMNFVIEWNASLTLPPALSGVEDWMRRSEQSAQASVALMLGGSGIVSTILSVLIVGVMAGLSEELFFRGTLQRLLGSGRLGPHLTVWLTAVIFSLFHMQFFGFFPRLLLGALFGYLLVWSGSLWLPVIIHILNNSIYVISVRHNLSDTIDTLGTGSATTLLLSVSITALLLLLLSRHASPTSQTD